MSGQRLIVDSPAGTSIRRSGVSNMYRQFDLVRIVDVNGSYIRSVTISPKRKCRNPCRPFCGFISHCNSRFNPSARLNPIIFSIKRDMGPNADQPQNSCRTRRPCSVEGPSKFGLYVSHIVCGSSDLYTRACILTTFSAIESAKAVYP